MTFTDDDLKRLKANWRVEWPEGLALLARLEAAEKALLASLILDENIRKLYDAWRKAAGK